MRKLLLEAPYQMHMVDAPIPEPAADEVRVRICKIGICGSDPTIYKGLHPYVTYPMVPGHELSGVIDAVGSHVDASRIGQRVTIIPHQVCGHCEACKHEIYNFCEELKCTGAEADGGMWKLTARQTIKEYLEKAMEHEVREGTVVIAL